MPTKEQHHRLQHDSHVELLHTYIVQRNIHLIKKELHDAMGYNGIINSCKNIEANEMIHRIKEQIKITISPPTLEFLQTHLDIWLKRR